MKATQLQCFTMQVLPVAALSVRVSHSRALVTQLCCQWHSSLNPPQGWRVAFVLSNGETIYGVATWGRPIARMEDQVTTLQHTRMALSDFAPRNSASWFMARMRAWIRAHMPHITRLIAYVDLENHSGITYRADNWRLVYVHQVESATWQNRSGRHYDRCGRKAKFEREP